MSRNSPKMLSRSPSLLAAATVPYCQACHGRRQSDPAATDSGRLHSCRHQAAGEFQWLGRRPQASRKPKSAIRLLDR